MNAIPEESLERPVRTWTTKEAELALAKLEAARRARWKDRPAERTKQRNPTHTLFLTLTLYLNLKRVYRRVWPFQLWKKPLPERI